MKDCTKQQLLFKGISNKEIEADYMLGFLIALESFLPVF